MSQGNLKPGIANDLGTLWDPEASRVAHVLVSHGRIEIVLVRPDTDWVDQALNTLAAEYPVIVIAGPGDAEVGEGRQT